MRLNPEPSNASPPSSDHQVPLLRLRHVMAVNLFKSLLLGQDHKPGDAQGDLVWSHFHAALQGAHGVRPRKEDALDERTWARWFEPNSRSTLPHKYEVLDRVLARASRQADGVADTNLLPLTLISSLASHGLVRELLRPTKSAAPIHTLAARAAEYRPVSMLHLHVDAIETAALGAGNGDVPWEDIKAIAARRILDLLHERWNRRSGYIYKELSSNYSVSLMDYDAMLYEPKGNGKLDALVAKRRESSPASPTWEITNVQSSEASIHVHRLLLALAADAKFLVADRFDAWFLDLATAGVAMFALAWCERQKIFGGVVSDEGVYWRAFDHIFYQDDPHAPDSSPPPLASPAGPTDSEEGEDGEWMHANAPILAGLELTGASWERCSVEVLLRARAQYHALLGGLNIPAEVIRQAIVHCTVEHKLRFLG